MFSMSGPNLKTEMEGGVGGVESFLESSTPHRRRSLSLEEESRREIRAPDPTTHVDKTFKSPVSEGSSSFEAEPTNLS